MQDIICAPPEEYRQIYTLILLVLIAQLFLIRLLFFFLRMKSSYRRLIGKKSEKKELLEYTRGKNTLFFIL